MQTSLANSPVPEEAGTKPRAYITGLGAVSCVGFGVDALWQAVQEGRSGLKQSAEGFCLGSVDQDILAQTMSFAEEVCAKKPRQSARSQFTMYTDHALVISAMQQAMTAAGWEKLNPDDAIIFATTTGQIPVWEVEVVRYLEQKISIEELAETFQYHSLGLTMSQICELFQFQGVCHLVSSACAASTQALALAKMWLAQGKVKRCLVGGSELLCDLTKRGFDSFQLLSKNVASPFDERREGINLSEGAGFLCLEAEPKGPILAEISGGGITSDAYHMTAPEPEGRGCFKAMELALQSAGISKDQITWVHAHGTGSPHNDVAEGKAIARLFGEHKPFVSSTKGIHGHALGASGVIESVLCIRAMQNQTVLASANLKNPDPAIQVTHPLQHLKQDVRHILKNTLGFGGANASVVISQVGADGERVL